MWVAPLLLLFIVTTASATLVTIVGNDTNLGIIGDATLTYATAFATTGVSLYRLYWVDEHACAPACMYTIATNSTYVGSISAARSSIMAANSLITAATYDSEGFVGTNLGTNPSNATMHYYLYDYRSVRRESVNGISSFNVRPCVLPSYFPYCAWRLFRRYVVNTPTTGFIMYAQQYCTSGIYAYDYTIVPLYSSNGINFTAVALVGGLYPEAAFARAGSRVEGPVIIRQSASSWLGFYTANYKVVYVASSTDGITWTGDEIFMDVTGGPSWRSTSINMIGYSPNDPETGVTRLWFDGYGALDHHLGTITFSIPAYTVNCYTNYCINATMNCSGACANITQYAALVLENMQAGVVNPLNVSSDLGCAGETCFLSALNQIVYNAMVSDLVCPSPETLPTCLNGTDPSGAVALCHHHCILDQAQHDYDCRITNLTCATACAADVECIRVCDVLAVRCLDDRLRDICDQQCDVTSYTATHDICIDAPLYSSIYVRQAACEWGGSNNCSNWEAACTSRCGTDNATEVIRAFAARIDTNVVITLNTSLTDCYSMCQSVDLEPFDMVVYTSFQLMCNELCVEMYRCYDNCYSVDVVSCATAIAACKQNATLLTANFGTSVDECVDACEYHLVQDDCAHALFGCVTHASARAAFCTVSCAADNTTCLDACEIHDDIIIDACEAAYGDECTSAEIFVEGRPDLCRAQCYNAFEYGRPQCEIACETANWMQEPACSALQAACYESCSTYDSTTCSALCSFIDNECNATGYYATNITTAPTPIANCANMTYCKTYCNNVHPSFPTAQLLCRSLCDATLFAPAECAGLNAFLNSSYAAIVQRSACLAAEDSCVSLCSTQDALHDSLCASVCHVTYGLMYTGCLDIAAGVTTCQDQCETSYAGTCTDGCNHAHTIFEDITPTNHSPVWWSYIVANGTSFPSGIVPTWWIDYASCRLAGANDSLPSSALETCLNDVDCYYTDEYDSDCSNVPGPSTCTPRVTDLCTVTEVCHPVYAPLQNVSINMTTVNVTFTGIRWDAYYNGTLLCAPCLFYENATVVGVYGAGIIVFGTAPSVATIVFAQATFILNGTDTHGAMVTVFSDNATRTGEYMSWNVRTIGLRFSMLESCDNQDADASNDCVGPATIVCESRSLSCDDGDECTIEAGCDPLTGECIRTLKTCYDDDPCTVDTCTSPTGTCVHRARTAADHAVSAELAYCKSLVCTPNCTPPVGAVVTREEAGDCILGETGHWFSFEIGPKTYEFEDCATTVCDIETGLDNRTVYPDGTQCKLGVECAYYTCTAGVCVYRRPLHCRQPVSSWIVVISTTTGGVAILALFIWLLIFTIAQEQKKNE